MFDIDAGKLLIIGVVALVVIGPKDLPRVLRQVGQMVGKLRRMAHDFQGQFMEAVKEADLQDLRQEVAKLQDSASIDVNFDPARDIQSELTKAVAAPVAEGQGGTSLTAGLTAPAVRAVPGTVAGPDTALALPSTGVAPAVEPAPSLQASETEVGASTETAAGNEPHRAPAASTDGEGMPVAAMLGERPRPRVVPRRRVPSRRRDDSTRDHVTRILPPVRRETTDP